MNWRTGAEPQVGEPLTDEPWPVKAKKLLTERERSLYENLQNLYPDHKLFVQVALSQLIDVPTNHPDRHSVRNRFSQLVADFVLCRKDLSVVAVIELDDPSHQRPDRQYADARKNKALADAGIRLVRIPAGRLPLDDALRAIIDGEDTFRIIPHSEVVLTLAEDVYPEEIAYNSEDESSAVSRELKRAGLKALIVVSLLLGGWLFFRFLLPMAMQQAFKPLAVQQARAAAARPQSALAGRPQNPARAIVSGPSASEEAALKQPAFQAANALQKKKDQAWAAFYTPPTSCEHPADWSAQVECGNQYMRAKKRFEERWEAEHASAQGAGPQVVLDNGTFARRH